METRWLSACYYLCTLLRGIEALITLRLVHNLYPMLVHRIAESFYLKEPPY